MQDDSVFADFDFDRDGNVVLLRISFDGYGCCQTEGIIPPMSAEASKRFVSLMEANDLESGDMASLLSNYFGDNSDLIWKDALEKHKLLVA